MTARDVTRSLGNATGTARSNPSSPVVTITISRGSERLIDTHGNPFGDNPLLITRVKNSPSVLNGRSVDANGVTVRFADNVPSVSFSYAFPTFLLESEAQGWSRGCSNTSPSRPEVQLPSLIFEMKDVPSMIRHAGRYLNGSAMSHSSGLSASKEAASANLALQFGWLPLVSDLKKLANFSSSVARRHKELDGFYSGKGLKRRLTLDERETNHVSEVQVHGTPVVIRGTIQASQKVKRWCVLTWRPAEPSPLRPSPHALRAMYLGLNRGAIASNVWEALPWSWLIDYFTNLGDVVASTNNMLGAGPPVGTVMTHLSQKTSFAGGQTTHSVSAVVNGKSVVTVATYFASGGTRLFETKSRKAMVGFPTPGASFPLLSGKQLSILASLAVMRR